MSRGDALKIMKSPGTRGPRPQVPAKRLIISLCGRGARVPRLFRGGRFNAGA